MKPFNYGNAISGSEAVKGQRLANRLSQMQMQYLPEKMKRERNLSDLQMMKAYQDLTQTKLHPFAKIEGLDGFSGQYNPATGNYENIKQTGGDQSKAIERAGKLRGEFTKATKGFASVNDAFGRIRASVTSPSPAGDLALIFNYMKMLDPGSTVREGEFATAEQAGSVPMRVVSMYNRLVSGERLSEPQRKDFFNRAGMLYKQAKGLYDRRAGEYTRIANSIGVDPSQVIVNQAIVDTSPISVPDEIKEVDGVTYYRIGQDWYAQ